MLKKGREFMQKVWNVKKYDSEYIEKIKKTYDVSEVMAKLLVARDIEFEDIDNFLKGTLQDIKDPYDMKDMDKFVDRVKKAIQQQEKICIYGDYDVDGITSITIMYQFLTNLGADVCYYLPDRLVEGYGVNNGALDIVKAKGTQLVITVDCGITAIEEVEYARKIGMDVCITDHHECAEVLPNAIAIVNPKQKEDTSSFKMHAGVGVAFKCLMALAKAYQLEENSYLQYLDIVAVGTISDIVPLVDENRIISKYGLQMMKTTKNIGLKALLQLLTFKDIDSTMVSFGMAPRINACGRMGNARVAVELLLEKDKHRAAMLAATLDRLNTKRQMVEKGIFEQAVEMITQKGLENKNSIVLYGKDWHNGVIGIVASRLVNMYFKPVILLTKENGVIRGSGRCPQGFSLYDSLTNCKEHLIQFGGHELAAGLSIEEEKIEAFTQAFEEIASQYASLLNEQMIEIDMEICRKDLNISLLKDIRALRPYGQSNKTPLFIYRDLKIKAIRTLKEDKHLKFTLQDDRTLIEGIAFSQGDRRDEFVMGEKIDVVATVELNVYNGKKTIQLLLQDFKKSV